MRMTIPKKITAADIISMNLNADDTTEYDYTGSTTYTIGDIRKVSYEPDGTTHRVPEKLYKALKAVATYPPDNISSTDPDWKDLGGTNRHRMFDFSRGSLAAADGTESTDPGKIVFEINTGKQDIVGLFNLVGTKVTFELKNPDGGVIDTTVYDLSRVVHDWKEYFFKDFDFVNDNLIHTYPLLLISTLKITIEHSASGSFPELGFARFGTRLNFGVVKDRPGSGLMDLSDTADDNGVATYQEGTSIKTMSLAVRVKNENYTKIQKAVRRLGGNPTIFEGMEDLDYDSFVILGFPRNFSLSLDNNIHSECVLEVQETT